MQISFREGTDNWVWTTRPLNALALGVLVEVGEVDEHAPADLVERDPALLHEPARETARAPRSAIGHFAQGDELARHAATGSSSWNADGGTPSTLAMASTISSGGQRYPPSYKVMAL
jgi:hypothetical protein